MFLVSPFYENKASSSSSPIQYNIYMIYENCALLKVIFHCTSPNCLYEIYYTLISLHNVYIYLSKLHTLHIY